MTKLLFGVGLTEQRSDGKVFCQGMVQGFAKSNILHCLFEIRAAYALNKLNRSTVSECLFGLLIGNEVVQIQHDWHLQADETVAVISHPSLAAHYQ